MHPRNAWFKRDISKVPSKASFTGPSIISYLVGLCLYIHNIADCSLINCGHLCFFDMFSIWIMVLLICLDWSVSKTRRKHKAEYVSSTCVWNWGLDKSFRNAIFDYREIRWFLCFSRFSIRYVFGVIRYGTFN